MVQRPTDRAAYVAWQLAQALGSRVERDVRRLGLSGAQTLALITLLASPGLTVADLARQTSMTPQAMGTAIQSLTGSGLVQSKSAEIDRRRKELFLTDEGRAKAMAGHTVMTIVNDDLLSGLSPSEQVAVLRTLTNMLRRFNPDAL